MTKSTKAPSQNSSHTPVPAPTKKPTKAELVRNKLATPGGVTLTELMEATGWQAHSVRAALSMLKKAETAIERLPKQIGAPEARYRIVTDAALQTETAPPHHNPVGYGPVGRARLRRAHLRAQRHQRRQGVKAPPDIASLETLGREGLVTLWAEVIKGPVPKQLSQPVLRRMLAFELQSRRQGGLGKGFLRRLQAAAGPDARSDAITEGAAAVSRAASRRLAPGARLLREWNGTTHAVEVTEDGFLWQGRRYRSLSVIARTITGAHWPGPRFFGLTSTEAAASGPTSQRKVRKAGAA